VRVVAPSGPFDESLLQAGLARLARYDVCVPPGLWGRRAGLFAGSDAERLAELQEALDDPEAGAVLVARGGYGLARILPQLQLERLLAAPRWLLGFSDTTVLHHALARRGLASLHCCNGTTLAHAAAQDVERLELLLGGRAAPPAGGLAPLVPGHARGPLLGGNLTVLFAEAAAGRLALPPGCVLFLEDIAETSYRLDRMLTALLDSGALRGVSGLVLGEFTDCSPGKHGVPAEQVLGEFAARLGVPAVAGLPAGHGARNLPFVHGAPVALDADAGALSFGA
jgi:muramoyltetrapeptide carboxypeptidase